MRQKLRTVFMFNLLLDASMSAAYLEKNSYSSLRVVKKPASNILFSTVHLCQTKNYIDIKTTSRPNFKLN